MSATRNMSTPTTAEGGLPLLFLPFIDMTTLSQSELRSLSLFSSSSSFHTQDDVVQPSIDPLSFNESAGSRRQTYSRLPSQHHHHHRHRLAGLLPKTQNPISSSSTITTDTDHVENRTIIKFLKQFLSSHPQFNQLDLVDFDSFTHLNDAINYTSNNSLAVVNDGVNYNGERKKRKRGRKPKKVAKVMEEEERDRQVVNKNGVVVDLVGLGSLEGDPYKEELKRRSGGMEKEEELLQFLRGLGGEWCSRRRKRKIVDASLFGDTLPVGWKLLLGLKRKDGHAWVYCRRYISPGGRQFVSCKEVSAYVQSLVGSSDARQAKDHAGDYIQQNYRLTCESFAGATRKEEDQRQSREHDKAVALLGFDNLELAEVQIHDLFECHKCKMTFDEKDTYLQHLLSFHQRTTRRYRLGSSVGDGVIVKDGKYECQFCHKVFHERRRYNGHVGIHVRNYVRGIEESPFGRMSSQKRNDSPTTDELPIRISKMDALIEIAQNSMGETSFLGPHGEPNGGFCCDKQNLVPNQELLASDSDHEVKSDSSLSEPDIGYGMIEKSQELEFHQQKSDHMIDDTNNMVDVKIDSAFANKQHGNTSETFGQRDCLAFCTDDMDKSVLEQEKGSGCHSHAPMSHEKFCSIENNMNLVSKDKQENCNLDEVDKTRKVEIGIGFGSNNCEVYNNIVQETVQKSFKDDGLQQGTQEPSASLLQPSHGISARNVSLDKEENEFSTVNQNYDRIAGFEELRLEEIEQLKFSFGTGQESISLSEVPVSVDDNKMEGMYDASVQFESEVVDASGGQQLTTVCVWCGVEFCHEAVDAELQSDSVGYMCPACKARISGQLNMLDGSCS